MMPTHGHSLRAHRGSVVLRDGAEFGAEQDEGLERMGPTRSLELTGRTVWPLQGLKDVWETLVLVQRTSWVCGCLLRCRVRHLPLSLPFPSKATPEAPIKQASPLGPCAFGRRGSNPSGKSPTSSGRSSKGDGLASSGQIPPYISFQGNG